VAQWLERQREDLMIRTSRVQIPLWDVGPYKRRSRVALLGQVKEPSRLKAMSAKHRSKFVALLPVMVTAVQIADRLFVRLYTIKETFLPEADDLIQIAPRQTANL
jgi:hypothetical protein